jgi:ClpP class serine protease
MLLELLQYRAWALAESYFTRIYPVVMDRLQKGSLDGLIKKQSIADYLPRIHALLNVEEGHPPVEGWNDELITSFYEVDPTTQKVRLASDRNGETLIPVVKSNGKTIAILPIIGPVSKYQQMCGPMGMQDVGNLIAVIEKSPEIHGLVLLMDTPGGTVDGTPELGLSIGQMKKPVGVFGDSMVASAGMWLASQADVIVGNRNNPTAFGSIGTFMVKREVTNQIEAGLIPKMEIVRAPQSTDKALINDLEPLTDELRAELKSELREITNHFISVVKAGRGDKLDSTAEGLFTGQMFDVYKAKQIGLIDAVGTLTTALNKVVELAKAQTKSQGTPDASASTANTQMKFPLLSKLFSGEAWNKALSAFGEDQAPLEAAEKAVADQEAALNTLKAELTEKDQTIVSLNASVAEKNSQIKKLEDEIASAPTGSLTTVISDDDKPSTKYFTSIDEEKKRLSSN